MCADLCAVWGVCVCVACGVVGWLCQCKLSVMWCTVLHCSVRDRRVVLKVVGGGRGSLFDNIGVNIWRLVCGRCLNRLGLELLVCMHAGEILS